MKVVIVLTGLLLAAGSPASACSINGYDAFVPAVDAFEAKFDDDGNVAVLPRPAVEIVGIQRGTVAPGTSCSDAGIIQLRLRWPDDSAYELEEVGFYFRVVSGEAPDLIFPLEPVVGVVDRGALVFVWLDGHPSTQHPLDLRIEVFAVNRGLEIGPSAYFDLKANPGEQRGPRLVPIG